MRRHYSPNDILVTPNDLWAFAWSAPMRDLAAKVGISDVGLKKLLASVGVAAPPRGYWNKLQAGKPVPAIPRAAPRRPGETGRIRLDSRFTKVIQPAPPLPSSGPFATAAVPEDLEALFAQELKAIGRAGTPKTLDGAHWGLVHLLKQEKRRHEKDAERQYNWDPPKFDNPLGKRRLRILNAIFLALAKRGHHGDVSERDGELHARAIVGDTYLGLDIAVAGKHRTTMQRGYLRPAPDLPATTPLKLKIDPNFDGKPTVAWQDDDEGRLEARIAPIAAGIIVAGEAKFRRGLKEAEERQEQYRAEQEKRRLEKLAQLNDQRIADLHKSGELLRQAQDIRTLVERMRGAMGAAGLEIEPEALNDWERWALAEADKLDPMLSGQVMKHLHEPTLQQVDELSDY
jgi:hypothetical protein